MRALHSSAPIRFEEVVQGRHFLTVKFPISDASGQITAVGGISIDITERIHAEKARADSEQKYRHLVELTHDLVWAVDSQGRITYVSPASRRLYGREPEEMIGHLFTEFMPEEYARQSYAELRSLVMEGRDSATNRHYVYDREGNVIILSTRSVVLRDETGTITGLVGTSQDITAQVQAEEELRRSRDRLEALSRQLLHVRETEQRAIGRELHDQVGQMLTAARITLEMHPDLPVEVVASKTTRAQEIIDDLLERVGRISLRLRPPMLDDQGLVPALTWHLHHFQEQTGLEVRFSQQGLTGRRFDPEIETATYRAVQEALTNIARHAEARQAGVELALRDDRLEIEIRDDGKGFDPASALLKNRGLGGMRERVGLIQGSLSIESSPGAGSQISIRLPVQEEAS